MFMLWEVPAPAWKGSTTKCSSNAPANASSAAATMAAPISAGSLPPAMLALAAAFLMATVAHTKAGWGFRPEMGKLRSARAVWAP